MKSLLSFLLHAVLLIGLIVLGVLLTARIVKSTVQDCQLSGTNCKLAVLHYADSLQGVRIWQAQKQAMGYQKSTAKRRRK